MKTTVCLFRNHITIRTIIRWIAGLAVFIFLGGVLIAWWQLHQTLAMHIPSGPLTPKDFGLPFESRSLTSSDGQQLAAWYIPREDPKAFAIVIHGFEEESGGKSEPFVLETAKVLFDAGYASLLIDLRSNGESEGQWVTLTVNEWKDAEAAYDYLKALPEAKNKKIGFVGDSMGASVAIVAAGKSGKGDFVVASVPFENYRLAFRTWMAQDGIPSVLAPFVQLAAFVQLGFNYPAYAPERWIESVKVPLLLIGAEHDEVVGTKIERLFDKANTPKTLWKPQGSNHQIVDELREGYQQRLVEFLDGLTVKKL